MPRPSDHSKLPELAVLALGMFIGLVMTNMFFVHGPGLSLTRINQTERITIECKAGAPASATPPALEPPRSTMIENLIGGLCVCALIGFLTFGWSVDLEYRLKKLEARFDSLTRASELETEWQRLSEGISKLETQMLQCLEK
jgi:hypothetical protein